MMSIIAIDVGSCARRHKFEKRGERPRVETPQTDPLTWCGWTLVGDASECPSINADPKLDIQTERKFSSIIELNEMSLEMLRALLPKVSAARRENLEVAIAQGKEDIAVLESVCAGTLSLNSSDAGELENTILDFRTRADNLRQMSIREHVEQKYSNLIHKIKAVNTDRITRIRELWDTVNEAIKSFGDMNVTVPQKLLQFKQDIDRLSAANSALNGKVIAERDEACKDPSMLQALEAKVHAHNYTIEPIQNELWAIRQKLDEIKTEANETKTEANETKTEADETKERIVTQCKNALDDLQEELKILANCIPGEKFSPESDPEFKDKKELVEAAKAAYNKLAVCWTDYSVRPFNAAKIIAMTLNVMAAKIALQDAFKAADVSAAPGNPAA